MNLEHTNDENAAINRNFEKLIATNDVAQFFSWGNGAPAHTPTSRQIYIRFNGGAGTTLYCWSGAAWNAFA